MIYWKYLSLISLIIFGCNTNNSEKKPPKKNDIVLSFIVAGHAYGNPDTDAKSIYPPFLKKMKAFENFLNPNYIIFTGDLVKKSTAENWNTVLREIDSLDTPWLIAPGNHDFSPYFLEKIQNTPYMSKRSGDNLLLLLNTNNSGWSTDSLQTDFITTTVERNKDVKNIFVFTHQLWWLKNMQDSMTLDSVRPNSYAQYDGDTDFWSTGYKAISSTDKPTYFFAGDMGCFHGLESYYEDHFENKHFYGSGMGGGVADNFLYVSVLKNGSIKITRVNF